MAKGKATREDALKIARYLGCRGAHQRPDGNWVPCSDEETLMRISNQAEGKAAKKKKKKKEEEDDGWENLDEGGIVGIDTLPDGSLVSASIGVKRVILSPSAKVLRRQIAKTEVEAKRLVAETKGDASTTRSSGKVSAEVEKSLKAKVTTHNKRMRDLGKPEWSMANVGQLRSVFLRGAGAYKVSHRKGTTQTQWAFARVNAFLRILSSGRPDNLKYMSDSDLLPDSHPWKKRMGSKALRRPASFDPNAVDGDNDGRVQDSTQFERPATPGMPSATTPRSVTSAPGQSAGSTTNIKPNSKRTTADPDYFGDIGYSRPPSMMDAPGSTSAKFSRGSRYSDDRYKKVHRKIIDAIVGTPKKRGKDRKDKKMWVLGGAPGSYKSSLRREGFMGMPGRTDASHIDPDEIKEMIPEFKDWVDAGHRGAANEVHGESRDIAKSTLKEAFDEGVDVVYDTSGQFGRGGEDLEKARSLGYRVVAHYTTGDVDVFKNGVKERAEATGRYIPGGLVEQISSNAPVYAQEMLDKDLFDEFYLWDTTKQGERVLVAAKLFGQDLQILDDKLYRRWKNGGR